MPDTAPPSIYDPRIIERVALALAIHRDQRWVYDDYRDATAQGLIPCFAAQSLMVEARAVLEVAGESIALTGMALARDGWVSLGTHANDGVPVEFHPDLDDGGMPMWERPNQHLATTHPTTDAVNPVRDLVADVHELSARLHALADEWDQRAVAHNDTDPDHEPSTQDWYAPAFAAELRTLLGARRPL